MYEYVGEKIKGTIFNLACEVPQTYLAGLKFIIDIHFSTLSINLSNYKVLSQRPKYASNIQVSSNDAVQCEEINIYLMEKHKRLGHLSKTQSKIDHVTV